VQDPVSGTLPRAQATVLAEVVLKALVPLSLTARTLILKVLALYWFPIATEVTLAATETSAANTPSFVLI
jgi:hypothetical protein